MVNRLKCNKDDIVVILNNLQRLTISICYNFLFTCLILNIEALSKTTYWGEMNIYKRNLIFRAVAKSGSIQMINR